MLRINAVGDFNFDGFDRCGACPALHLVPAKRPVLEGHKPWRVAGEADVRGQFALEHLAGEQQLVTFFLVSNAVADRGAFHRGRQLGNKITHLISVRHQHQFGLFGCDELLQPGGESVGRVRFEFRRLDGINFRDFLARNFGGKTRDAAADDGRLECPAGFGGESLSGGEVSQETRFSLPSRCSTMTRIESAMI